MVEHDGGVGVPSETWTYTHDAFDRETNVAQHSVATGVTTTQASTFDALGRVTKQTGAEGTLRFTYDNFNRSTSMSVAPTSGANERVTNYAYDPLGRLATVTEHDLVHNAPDQAHAYHYDLQGRLDSELAANNVFADYDYDPLGRLDKLTHYQTNGFAADLANLSDNPKVAEFDYTVRADGRRTAITESFLLDPDHDGAFNTFTAHKTYGYDNLNRLTDEVLDHWDNSLDYHTTYAFDATSNRVSKTTDQGNNDKCCTLREGQT